MTTTLPFRAYSMVFDADHYLIFVSQRYNNYYLNTTVNEYSWKLGKRLFFENRCIPLWAECSIDIATYRTCYLWYIFLGHFPCFWQMHNSWFHSGISLGDKMARQLYQHIRKTHNILYTTLLLTKLFLPTERTITENTAKLINDNQSQAESCHHCYASVVFIITPKFAVFFFCW